MWFNKERKKKMVFLQNFVPTSKAQLLQVAMYLNKGDTEKAQQFYDFYARNLELPDFDPVPPTFIQQLRTNANGLFSWIKENQGDIINGYQFIQNVIRNRGEIVPTDAAEALPPINE